MLTHDGREFLGHKREYGETKKKRDEDYVDAARREACQGWRAVWRDARRRAQQGIAATAWLAKGGRVSEPFRANRRSREKQGTCKAAGPLRLETAATQRQPAPHGNNHSVSGEARNLDQFTT